MKIRILLVLAALFSANVMAQNIDLKGIEAFVNDIKALDDELVECNLAGYDSLMNNIISQIKEQSDEEFNEDIFRKRFYDSEFKVISITSLDAKGYSLMSDLVTEYDLDVTENFCGIPLVISKREDGEQEILFTGSGYTIIIRDDFDSEYMEIVYSNCNMIEILQKAMMMTIMGFDEDMIENNPLLDGDISFSLGLVRKNSVKEEPVVKMPVGSYPGDIIAAVSYEYNMRLKAMEKELVLADNEKREEISTEMKSFSEKMTRRLETLRAELDEIERPCIIDVPELGKNYVVIPANPHELLAEAMPYAVNGIYDWINETGFCDDNLDHISYIVTPRDVVIEYAVKHWSRDKWHYDGYSDEVKEAYMHEFQGGTPAILCRFSQNEKGYKKMIADFDDLFTLGLDSKYHNLEVTHSTEVNGKRFVQLYGEGDILMCVYDSPAEKYCHMSIIVGYDAFEQAVNECVMGNERDIAKKCNIIINDDFSHRFGIQFTNSEYLNLGKKYKSGVHINFGYAKKLLDVE